MSREPWLGLCANANAEGAVPGTRIAFLGRMPPAMVERTATPLGECAAREIPRFDQSPEDRILYARIRSEFLEMPGLVLTLEQAARLFNLERDRCARALKALVEMKALASTGGNVLNARLPLDG